MEVLNDTDWLFDPVLDTVRVWVKEVVFDRTNERVLCVSVADCVRVRLTDDVLEVVDEIDCERPSDAVRDAVPDNVSIEMDFACDADIVEDLDALIGIDCVLSLGVTL